MPSPAVRFRVISPFLAFGTFETNSFVSVPIGSIIATQHEILDPGLVEIRLNDQPQPLLAFTRDITERTEAVNERARGARLGYVDSFADLRSMPVEVLLIEDNPAEARLIEKLAAHGSTSVRITTANDCSGALARLSDPHFKPHLVIADMGVLEFGGVELLGRCNPRGIPVVIFTGSENPAHAAHALALGAKEFVVKPNELDDYADAVSKMISKWTVPQA